MVEEALIYLSMGWAVYPAHSIDLLTNLCSCGNLDCSCPGKHPVGSWSEYRNKLPTEREVANWFIRDCNIGTITGLVSGIVVVDIDGEEGIKSARGLNLQPTLTARTGGGGYHLFYSTDKPVDCRVRAYEGIDIRGDGGYVVLTPSLHKSGRHYEWLEVRGLAPFDPSPFERYSSAIPNLWLSDALRGVGKGERSTTAVRLTGRYFKMGLSRPEVEVLMFTWNENNDPPLERSDLMRTIQWTQRQHEETSVPAQIRTLSQIRDLLGGQDE